MPSILGTKTAISTTLYTGGKTDAKGRVEGLCVEEWEATLIERPDNVMTYYGLEPGFYYVAHMTKTKNGEKFGASQPRQYFKTPEERQAAIVKRLGKVL